MDVPVGGIDPIALALMLMFGSLLAGLAVGALVGWRTQFEAGAAVALLALGAGGLSAAVLVARHFHVDTAVVTARRSGCSEQPGQGRVAAYRTERFSLVLPDGRELTLQTPELAGRCDEDDADVAQRLRYRLDDAQGAGVVAASLETDERAPKFAPWVFAAFGSFGLLAGLFFLAIVRSAWRRRRHGADVDVAPTVSAGRRSLSGWLILTGNVLVLVAGIATVFSGDDSVVSTFRLFASIAVACLCYGAAFALRRMLRLETALILLIIGAGFAAAAWSVLVLG